MSEFQRNPGNLIKTYRISPASVQKAVVIAILAFIFFLGMMFAFYAFNSLVYFILASAFLVIYIFTMFSVVIQKRSAVNLYENGITYRKLSCGWDEIGSFKSKAAGKGRIYIEIKGPKGKTAVLPETLENAEEMIRTIRGKLAAGRRSG
jgi:hypothetical protein